MKFNTIFLSGMACSFGPFFAVAQQATKPNVVVIMADDIGYGDLSCYGEKTIHTPNVEKLADGGNIRWPTCSRRLAMRRQP